MTLLLGLHAAAARHCDETEDQIWRIGSVQRDDFNDPFVLTEILLGGSFALKLSRWGGSDGSRPTDLQLAHRTGEVGPKLHYSPPNSLFTTDRQ